MLYRLEEADRYLQRLFFEIDSYHIQDLETIYVGGGTPTSLNPNQLKSLIEKLSPLLKDGGEFSVEANIENASQEKLRILKQHGVNRLSFGVQSFQPRLLRHMNRLHDEDQTNIAISQAKECGFTNISVDLIYDLPTQNDADLIDDIQKAIALDVPHISTYSLSIHHATVYGIRGYLEADSDESRRHYDIILSMLRAAGYTRYEVSNFAKPGYMGRHNLTYWNNEQYYGVGLGASGYVKNRRYTNTKNFRKYLEGSTISEQEEVTITDQETYFLMLKLRLQQGFSDSEYRHMFKQSFTAKYPQEINLLLQRGLLHHRKNRWYATDEGLMLLDQVLLTLLKEH